MKDIILSHSTFTLPELAVIQRPMHYKQLVEYVALYLPLVF